MVGFICCIISPKKILHNRKKYKHHHKEKVASKIGHKDKEEWKVTQALLSLN